MSNLLHPGLILIAVGVLAVLVPKMLRKFILAIGPFFALLLHFLCRLAQI